MYRLLQDIARQFLEGAHCTFWASESQPYSVAIERFTLREFFSLGLWAGFSLGWWSGRVHFEEKFKRFLDGLLWWIWCNLAQVSFTTSGDLGADPDERAMKVILPDRLLRKDVRGEKFREKQIRGDL